MTRFRRLAPALGAALLLAACAGGPPPGEPAPAARFEPGGGRVTEVKIAPGQTSLEGIWQGPYVPVDMAAQEITGGPAGVATLSIGEVDGTLTRGLMSWDDADADFRPQPVTGALTMTGHIMALNAHFMLMQQDGVEFLQADLVLPDGGFYRHRLRRVE
jgi:hypothetical protein